MKESDISVKQLALELVFVISNEQNVKSIVKELLNHLLTVTDESFLKELTNKVSIGLLTLSSDRPRLDRFARLLMLTRQTVDGKLTR